MSETRQRAVNAKDRVPVGGRNQNLQLSALDQKVWDDKHRVLRWFNDTNGRIEQAEAGGWTFVEPNEAKSLGRSGLHQENSDLNSKVSKVVSRSGDPIRAYLMSISKEWFDEDQERKEDINRQVDIALGATNQGGQSIEGGYTPT